MWRHCFHITLTCLQFLFTLTSSPFSGNLPLFSFSVLPGFRKLPSIHLHGVLPHTSLISRSLLCIFPSPSEMEDGGRLAELPPSFCPHPPFMFSFPWEPLPRDQIHVPSSPWICAYLRYPRNYLNQSSAGFSNLHLTIFLPISFLKPSFCLPLSL